MMLAPASEVTKFYDPRQTASNADRLSARALQITPLVEWVARI
jgi:hypothetical protein